MTRDRLIDVIESTARRVCTREPGPNERARAFVAQLSGALEQDHPEAAELVFSLVNNEEGA